jgi:hypothetical protein
VDKNLFGPIDVGTWNGTVSAPKSTGLTNSHAYDRYASERRWEAAETDRLNEAHWQPVTLNMNEVLETQISELQARCRHEAANNPVVDAGIETLEECHKIADFAEINGIGKALSTKIKKYINTEK